MSRYINALYIIKLTRNPVPWMQTDERAMATELIRAAAVASGKASIRLEASGAIRSRGYAGNIQMGVMV
jgi:hypothetical protein